MPSLEEKQAEKERLAKAYRARKRQKWKDMCEREPRILAFQKDVRTMKSPAEILEYVSRSWVMQADADTRLYALRIINKHADDMALKQGRPRLDDPIPPARNLFIAARELLAVR